MIIQDLKEKLGLGGDHYIIDLTMGVSSSAYIEYHVTVILEKFILRSLINVSANAIDNFLQRIYRRLNSRIKPNNLFLKLPTEPSKGFDT